MVAPQTYRVSAEAPTVAAQSGTGLVWGNPSYAVDGLDTTAASISGYPSGYSKTLTLTGFNFSWFDGVLLDMVGMYVTLKTEHISTSIAEITTAQFVDETGAALGPDFSAALMAKMSGGYVGWQTAEVTIPIPPATYSSPNFGLKLVIHEIVYMPFPAYIYDVELTPIHARKVIYTVGNYGFALADSGAVNKLTAVTTFARHIHTSTHAGGSTPVISVPGFDDTKGVLYFGGILEKYRTDSNTQQAKTYAWGTGGGGPGYMHLRGHALERPNMIWDNVAKTATVSTGGVYPLNPAFEDRSPMSCGWTINMVHYR